MDARRRGRRRLALAALILALGTGAPAAQAGHVETIVQDDALMLHGSEEEIRKGMARTRELGIDRVRLTAGWSVLAPDADAPEKPDFDATDPAAYPDGIWSNLDRAVRLAHEAGLEPMIDIAFWAPRWATKEPAGTADRLAAEIDPRHFADFAHAVALRYSGTWTPVQGSSTGSKEPNPDRTFLDELFGKPKPASQSDKDGAASKPLPAVDTFTLWNEPNHPGFLRPQWVNVDGTWVPRAADIYRKMVRLGYPAVKKAAPDSRVLIGGTASGGSSTPGRSGVPPLRFLRALACVDADLQPVTSGECAGFDRLPGDGWAHHPYSLRTTPDRDTLDRDKLPVAATKRLAATLRALVDGGRLAPAVADLYMTEYGYETSTPDPNAPFSLEDQGRLLAWAEYIATSEPSVRSWPQFQLYDRPDEAPRPGMRPFGDWHSGLYFNNGEPKPAAATYATPMHAACVPRTAGRWALVWGRVRGHRGVATATLEARSGTGNWESVASFPRPRGDAGSRAMTASARDGDAVTRYVRHARGTEYRLRWSAEGKPRISAAGSPVAETCRRGAASARAAKRRAAKSRARAAKRRAAKKRSRAARQRAARNRAT